MQCYYVLIHGRLNWYAASTPDDEGREAWQPSGFYCHRYVLASSTGSAEDTAFRRVRENLERQTGWLSANQVKLDLHTDEVTRAPIFRLLKPDNRGHSFYNED